jgi:hypothetical protein
MHRYGFDFGAATWRAHRADDLINIFCCASSTLQVTLGRNDCHNRLLDSKLSLPVAKPLPTYHPKPRPADTW